MKSAFAYEGTQRLASSGVVVAIHGGRYNVGTREGKVWQGVGGLTPLATLRVGQRVALFWDDHGTPWILGAYEPALAETQGEDPEDEGDETRYTPPTSGWSWPAEIPVDLIPGGIRKLGSTARPWNALYVDEIYLDGAQLRHEPGIANLLANSSMEPIFDGASVATDWTLSVQTTLSTNLPKNYSTSLTVTDETILNAGGGDLLIGQEWIQYASASGNTAYTLTRGAHGSTAAPHKPGDPVLVGSYGAIPQVLPDSTAHGGEAVLLTEGDSIAQAVNGLDPGRYLVFSVYVRRHTSTPVDGEVALEYQLPGEDWVSCTVYREGTQTAVVPGDNAWYRFWFAVPTPVSSSVSVRVRAVSKRLRVDRAMLEISDKQRPSTWIPTSPSVLSGERVSVGTLDLGGANGAGLNLWDADNNLVGQLVVDPTTGGKLWTTYAALGGTGPDNYMLEVRKDGSIHAWNDALIIDKNSEDEVLVEIRKGGLMVGAGQLGAFVGVGSQWGGIQANVEGGKRFFRLNVFTEPYQLWVGDTQRFFRYSQESGLELHGDALMKGTLQVDRLVVGEMPKVFLEEEYIWAGSYENPHNTSPESPDWVKIIGVLHDQYGIKGYLLGNVTAGFGIDGRFYGGQYDQCVIAEDGLVSIVSVDNPQGVFFRREGYEGSELGGLLATMDPASASPRDNDVNLYVRQEDASTRANVSIWAFNPWSTGYAVLQLSSHDQGITGETTAWLFARDKVQITSDDVYLDGPVRVSGSHDLRVTNGSIVGKLVINPDYVGVSEYDWGHLQLGAITVVVDSQGNPQLRVKARPPDGYTLKEYRVNMTEVLQ